MNDNLHGRSWLRNSAIRGAFLCVLGLAAVTVHPLYLRAGEPQTVASTALLEKQIEGTWVYVGKPGETNAPTAGVRFKTIQQGTYKVTQKDPKSGEPIYHHGGVYTLDGDLYAEEVTYSSEKRPELQDQTFKFRIKIEGDTLTQTGVGNPWTEVWKRVKAEAK